MMKLIQVNDKKLNDTIQDTRWEHGLNGFQFEDEIEKLLVHILDAYTKVEIKPTKKTGDEGKDFIIIFHETIVLFDKTYEYNDKSENQIYVEVKQRKSRNLNLNEIASATLVRGDEQIIPKALIIITDSYITPKTHAHAKFHTFTHHCDFTIIDQFALIHFIHKYEVQFFNNVPSVQIFKDSLDMDILVRYEKEDITQRIECNHKSNTKAGNQDEQKVYIQIRNLHNKPIKISIKIYNDITSKLSQDSTSPLYLEPYEVISKTYILTEKIVKHQQLEFLYNPAESKLIIDGNLIPIAFKPELFGNKYFEVQDKISELLKDKTTNIIHIEGEAGVGKSKVIENFSNLASTGFYKFYNSENNLENVIKILNINNLEAMLTLKYKTILILDDLHNAEENFFKEFEKLYQKLILSPNAYLKIILIGRNDDTVINHSYSAFKETIHESVQNIQIKKWDTSECKEFIQKIVIDIPKSIEDKIVEISNCTPFGVIETIHYLLDKNIAEIYSSELIGITNLSTINSKIYIPNSLEELIQQRFTNIENVYALKLHYFMALSMLGGKFSKKECLLIFNTRALEIDNILDLLKNKHIISYIKKDDLYEFSHENLYLFLQNIVINYSITNKNTSYTQLISEMATLLLDNIDNFDTLKTENNHAYLYFLKNDSQNAYDKFTKLIDYIEINSKNTSSILFEKKYLKYLQPLYETLLQVGKNDLVKKVIQTEVHISTHLEHLKLSISRAERCEKFLKIYEKKIPNTTILKIQIQSQKAHSILNLGFVSYAKSLMEELLLDIRLINISSYDNKEQNLLLDIEFDINDRLQNIYHQLNHKKMFLNYSKITERLLEIKKGRINDLTDEISIRQLESLVKSSRVKELYYINPVEHYKQTLQATHFSSKASDRHKQHALLNMYISYMIIYQQEQSKIEKVRRKLIKVHQKCQKEEFNYTFSITRSLLALATTYAVSGLNDKENLKMCEYYTNQTIESIIKYGNGFFTWQAYNLKAIIEYNKTKNIKKVNGYFANTIEILKEQGLLNIGNFDLLSINLSVITNYFNFVNNYKNKKSLKFFVFKILTYNHKCYKKEMMEFENKIEKSLQEYNFIGLDKEYRDKLKKEYQIQTYDLKKRFQYLLNEPNSGYYLALR